MKNLLTVAIATLLLIIVSCSTEEDDYTIDQVQSVDLASDVYQDSNVGIYNGVFTTLDGNQRGSVEITIPADNSRNANAIITLSTGEIILLLTNEVIKKDFPIENITFGSDATKLSFSVNANGKNPSVDEVLMNYLEADIIVRKHTSKAPVVPISGTYACTDCANHPVLGTGSIQTFNILMFATPGGDSGFDTQVTLDSTIFNGTGFQSNCSANGTATTCDISGSFTVSGGQVTWSGAHIFNNEATGMQDCSGASGTWTIQSVNFGTLTGTFLSDEDCVEDFVLYTEGFDNFTGAGFAPTPAVGQLDSDIVIANGFSGSLAYGGTQDTGDYARGSDANGGVGTGGIYAFDVDGNGQIALGVQPGGSDFTPGEFEFRIANTSGSDLNNFTITYDLWVNNDQGRGNSLNFSYSTDGISFTNVAALDFTSDTTSDSNGFTNNLQSGTFSESVADGTFIYFRFEGNDVSGSNFRDEFAIDNIHLSGN